MTIKANTKILIAASASIDIVIGKSSPETSPLKLSYKVLDVSRNRTQSANRSVEAIAKRLFDITGLVDDGFRDFVFLLETTKLTRFNAETSRMKTNTIEMVF